MAEETQSTEQQNLESKKVVTKKPVKKVVTKKPAKKSSKTEGYGIAYLAKQLGRQPVTVRLLLRKNKVKKPGKSYTWATQGEADKVLKSLKAS